MGLEGTRQGMRNWKGWIWFIAELELVQWSTGRRSGMEQGRVSVFHASSPPICRPAEPDHSCGHNKRSAGTGSSWWGMWSSSGFSGRCRRIWEVISDWQSWTSVMLPKLFDIPHRLPVSNYMLLVFSSTKSKWLMIKIQGLLLVKSAQVGKTSFYKASVFEKRQSWEQYFFCEISPLVRHKAEAPVRLLGGGCPSVLKPHSLTHWAQHEKCASSALLQRKHTHTRVLTASPGCIGQSNLLVLGAGDQSRAAVSVQTLLHITPHSTKITAFILANGHVLLLYVTYSEATARLLLALISQVITLTFFFSLHGTYPMRGTTIASMENLLIYKTICFFNTFPPGTNEVNKYVWLRDGHTLSKNIDLDVAESTNAFN